MPSITFIFSYFILACSYKCNTCIDNSSDCRNDCSDVNRSGLTCECNPTFYDDGSNAACIAC